MKNMEFNFGQLKTEDSTCWIVNDSSGGNLNIIVRYRPEGSRADPEIIKVKTFKHVRMYIASKYKVQADDIEWLKLLRSGYNVHDNYLKIIEDIPEDWKLIITNDIIWKATLKYGPESKQVKAIIKLYKD